MRGKRHQSVADFVREPVSHGFDQTQIGRFDFQAAQLFALREIFDHQQRGKGLRRVLALERHHGDAVNRAAGIFGLVLER